MDPETSGARKRCVCGSSRPSQHPPHPLRLSDTLPTCLLNQVDAVNTQRTALESRYVEVQDGLAAAEAELEGAEHEVARLQVSGGERKGGES